MDKLIASLITASALLSLDALLLDQRKGVVGVAALQKAYACRCYLDSVGA